MTGNFADLHAVLPETREDQPRLLEFMEVYRIHLIPVAMPFRDLSLPVDLHRKGILFDSDRVIAEAHGPAKIGHSLLFG